MSCEVSRKRGDEEANFHREKDQQKLVIYETKILTITANRLRYRYERDI